MANDKDQLLLELKVFYENHPSSKDVEIFKDMASKFDGSTRTYKRYKKKYGWHNKTKDEGGSEKTREKSAITKQRPTARLVTKQGSKSTPPPQRKKRTEAFVPDKQRVESIRQKGIAQQKEAEEAEYVDFHPTRVDLVRELVTQGARMIDLSHYIDARIRLGDQIWRDFDKGTLGDLLEEVREAVVKSYTFDVEYEFSQHFNRLELLFASAIKNGNEGVALKIQESRINSIRGFYETLNIDRLRRQGRERVLSTSEMIDEIDKIKELIDEPKP